MIDKDILKDSAKSINTEEQSKLSLITSKDIKELKKLLQKDKNAFWQFIKSKSKELNSHGN